MPRTADLDQGFDRIEKKQKALTPNPWLDKEFNKMTAFGREPGFRVDDIPERLGLLHEDSPVSLSGKEFAKESIGAGVLGKNSVLSANIKAKAITSDKVAQAAITASLIAEEFKILEILDALPAAGTAGRLVFLTTDEKIYRDNGTAWVELIMPASVYEHLGGTDIPTIDTEAIANAAVEGAKIATGAITAIKIAALAVEAGKIAANAITADEIAANSVDTSELVAGAVTADIIAANAVIADKIAANAVTAAKIAAGTITADEITAGTITAAEILIGGITQDRMEGYFKEEFDGLSTAAIHGQGSYNWFGAWVTSADADCLAEVAVRSGANKLLRLYDNSATGMVSTQIEMSGYHDMLVGIVEFSILQSTATKLGYFSLFKGASLNMGIKLGSDSLLHFYNGASYTSLGVTYEVDTWYNIKIIFDCIARAATVFVDGVHKLWIALDAGAQCAYVDIIKIYTTDAYTGYAINVDDLKVVNFSVT